MTPSSTTRRLLDRIDDLKVFPAAAARVISVVHHPASTLQDMEEAVGSDPVLAGRVVQLANSAMYARAGHVVSWGHAEQEPLRRAIQVLGFHGTRDLALALALSSIGSEANSGWAALWHHAVWAGRAAREMEILLGRDAPRGAFICALLHDVGRQLMSVLDPVKLQRILAAERDGHPRVAELELDAFGAGHEELGAACLYRWSFRKEVADVVASHHLPMGEVVGAASVRMVAVVQVADAFADALAVSDHLEGVTSSVSSEPGCRVLRLKRSMVEHLSARLLEAREERLPLAA